MMAFIEDIWKPIKTGLGVMSIIAGAICAVIAIIGGFGYLMDKSPVWIRVLAGVVLFLLFCFLIGIEYMDD